MNKYEIMIISKPNLKNKKSLVTEIEKKLKGKIVKKDDWGLRKFEYPIKKFEEGEYLIYYIENKPENIADFRNYVRLSKDILRILVLRHEIFWPFDVKSSKDLKIPERKPRKTWNSTNKKEFVPKEKQEKKEENKNE